MKSNIKLFPVKTLEPARGMLVINDGLVVLITHTSDTTHTFSGIIVHGQRGKLAGQFAENFSRYEFELFNGEITLSN